MATDGWPMVRTRNKDEAITTRTIKSCRESNDLKLTDAVVIEPFMKDERFGETVSRIVRSGSFYWLSKSTEFRGL